MKGASINTEASATIVNMVEDIVKAMLMEYLRGRESGDAFGMVVPEGYLAVGIHKIHAFLMISRHLKTLDCADSEPSFAD
jgi:hypothetical protein